jgi:MATE family multidrug resistance protein
MHATPDATLPSPSLGAPSLRALLTLAWPLVVSRASQVVVGLCDALMVASLGEAALAATTTGALNTFALLILPMGIAFIVSSFAAQYFGKGDLAGARRYGCYGLVLSGVFGALGLATIAAVPTVLEWLPYGPDVRAHMDGYLRLRLLSVSAAVAIEALGNYYGGLGNTRLPMVANVAAMVLNVLGNWLFIHGNLGAPALGVRGAALASTLATTAAALFLLVRFVGDGRALGRVVPPGLSLPEFGRMLRFGIPSGLNWFFEFFAFLFFVNIVFAGLGTTSLAALMAVMQINSVSFMPAFGLASAGAILVGQTIGAGAKARVPSVVKLTFLTASVWQGFVGLLYLFAPGPLLSAFAGPDAGQFRQVGVRLLMLSAAWQIFDSAATTLAESLRAAGDTAFTMWARIVIAWVIFAPGSYVTVRVLHGTDVAAVAWLVLYLVLLAATLFVRFRAGAWRRFELTEGVPPVT